MKNFLFVLLMLPFAALANDGNPTIDAITAAIKSGDVSALSAHFNSKVEVSILDSEKMCSKAEAIKLVKGFFESNAPKGYTAMHQGSSRENSDQYCIGNLDAASGTYRVYIYLKSEGSKLTISEIRFDKG